MPSTDLRTALWEMIDKNPTSEHPRLLEKLRVEYNHTIQVIQSVRPLKQYNCLMYALRLHDQEGYEKARTRDWGTQKGIFAGPDFAHWLIEHQKLTEVSCQELQPSCLVFYFRQQSGQTKRCRHAAICKNGQRVVSKWGFGQLYEHALLEVPCIYGSACRAFLAPTADDALRLFMDYKHWRVDNDLGLMDHNPQDD